jgi:energy-coupling factor transport system permease protein
LFVSAFRRADELATAMEARCYRGGEGRTRLRELKLTANDLVAVAALAAVSGAVIYLRYAGGAA